MKKKLLYILYSLLFFLPVALHAQTANHVVISEVFGGGGNGAGTVSNPYAPYANDYVELYNPTSADINIGGWSVQYASAAGTTVSPTATGLTPIPAGAIIKAHSYFLIQGAAGTNTAAGALPTPDVSGGLSISGTTGKVFLVNVSTALPAAVADATVVDYVGWGPTATPSEGSNPAPIASNTTSIERKANATSTPTSMTAGGSDDLKGNGYDSDNNGNDFIVPLTLNPQNSASPVEPALAVTPTLTPSATTLTFSQAVSTTSAAQTFTLTGSNLTAGATLTVAAPFAISATTNGTYGTNLSFTQTQLASPQTVYVQFTAPATAGPSSGTINIASGTATASVTLNGTATSAAAPTLAILPVTPLTFSQAIGSASAAQSFTVSGTNIPSTGVTVSVAAPYAISTAAAGTYGTNLTFTQTQMATAQTVYVQFTPTAVGAANGTVTIAATGATSQTVTLNGTGTAAVNTSPTLNAITDITLCYTAAQQTIALSGITPGSEATQTVVISVTSTNPALFSQIGVFPIVGGTTGQLNYTIAPNASGTAVVTVTVKDNGGTANGGVDTYTRSFNITVNSLPNVNIVSNVGTNITKGVTAQLTATAGGATYAWTPTTGIISGQNTATVTVRPTTTTTYTVVVSNALGCSTTQTITLNVSTIYPLVTSNIITPNGDGKNDTWIIKNIDYYPTSSVKVVDKAGKVVFTATNYLNDWGGTYNGQPLTQGTYYYVIDLGSGAPKYTGYVTIIRD